MNKALTARMLVKDVDPDRLLTITGIFIEDPPFELDIQMESHLKHLIDLYSKVLYMNKSQIPLVNYNLQDAYRIVDSLGGFLASSKYYEKHMLQLTYEIIPLA
jgi:hypothetical protein